MSSQDIAKTKLNFKSCLWYTCIHVQKLYNLLQSTILTACTDSFDTIEHIVIVLPNNDKWSSFTHFETFSRWKSSYNLENPYEIGKSHSTQFLLVVNPWDSDPDYFSWKSGHTWGRKKYLLLSLCAFCNGKKNQISYFPSVWRNPIRI